MGKNPRIGDPIDRLLSERQQYATWLARLDATSDSAPESVRGKIRADYQARLDIVLEQLRSHSDGLVQQLERHRETRGELQTREAQAKDIMSEAEVRHSVGEYSDAKWQQIRGEAQKNLVSIREELAECNDEIAELEKVQLMIASPAVAEPPPPAPAPLPTPEPPKAAEPPPEPAAPAPVHMTSERIAPAAAQPVPATGPPKPEEPAATAQPDASKPGVPGPGQTTIRPGATVRPVKPKEGTGGPPGRTLWFPSVKEEEVNAGVDELAFLKSVSEDEQAGPSPRRASGGQPRPIEPGPAPSVSSAPVANPPAGTEAGRPSSSTGARTLKCGECGTMNRPTEWYCERCGAELADL
jgi:ElaB/YqjD/DUF883 family membrane-anchored ribosome-binding protein